jgi:uncharacterized protein YabE (DUF348 family)
MKLTALVVTLIAVSLLLVALLVIGVRIMANPKIDIYVDGKYVVSTTWAKTNREAKERFLNAYPQYNGRNIKTRRAE